MSSVFSAITSLPGWNMSVLLLLAKATVILLAALGITRAMQRASATARHLVWLVTLGTILLVPAMTAWAPIEVAVLPAVERTSFTAPKDYSTLAKDYANTPAAPGVPSVTSRPTTESVTSPGLADRVRDAIASMSGVSMVLTVWGAVVFAIIAMLAVAAWNVRRIVRRARPLTSPDWETPLYEIADRLGLEDAPRLLQSDDAKMPFACGVMKATIVLPAEAEQWTLDRRRAVLLHELAHVRRHDLLGHTLGRLACAVYWFHPLVWTAAKELRSESERACDDLALTCGTRATDYAEHLLDIVTSVRGENTPLVALAMARRKEFEGRMLAILDPELRHSAPTRKQSAALIGTLALVALTVGAISPVARNADAAVIDHRTPAPLATPVASEAPAPHPTPSPSPDAAVQVQMRKAYPDSGVRGEKSTQFSVRESTSMSVSTATSTSQSTVTQSPIVPSAEAIDKIARAGANVGLNMAVNVMAALGGKGEKGAKDDERADLLVKALKTDSSAAIRRIAAWGLQEYADQKGAESALLNAVKSDADGRVREMAAWSLTERGNRSSAMVDAMTHALKNDPSPRMRATAAWALGELDEKSALDALVAATSDSSREVRVKAVWAIGTIEPKQAPKQVVAMLGDSEARVRELAAWALFQIEDPATIQALETAMKKEQNPQVQIAEVRALAALGERSVDALRSLLESKDQNVKAMAIRALAGGRGAGPWPWPWPDPRPSP